MRPYPVLLAVVSAFLMLRFAPVYATFELAQEQIVFGSDRSGVNQIYSMNADGSNVRQLTTGEYDYYMPLWSPDGQKLTYTERVDHEPVTIHRSLLRLMISNADASSPIELARDAQGASILPTNSYSDWSPDSQHLIYAEIVPTTYFNQQRIATQYFLVNRDGTNNHAINRRLMRFSTAQFWDDDLIYLNASNQVARTAVTEDDWKFMMVGVLAPSALSPDRSNFVAVDAAGNLVAIDLTGQQRTIVKAGGLGKPIVTTYYLNWSPDGVYVYGYLRLQPDGKPAGPADEVLFTARADGSERTILAANDSTLSWSSDSEHVTYTAYIDGRYQVMVARPDGTEAVAVTTLGNNSQPAWRPTHTD